MSSSSSPAPSNAAPLDATPAAESKPAADAVPATLQSRLVSLDAYRGWTMFFMASGGLGLATTAENFPESDAWQTIGYQFEHVPWVGCAFWDLIQPSFMFIVGVSMFYSYTKRVQSGDSQWNLLGHTLWRSLALILLGVFLRSRGSEMTNWRFDDVVTQIGFGYPVLYLVWNRRPGVQLAVACAILLAYWLLFALWPLPGADYNYAAAGTLTDWPHRLSGFAAHWNINANPAHYFDVWLLNLFPRSEPFYNNGGGYQTLNFIPSIATMIFGLMAGRLMKSDARPRRKLAILLVAAALGFAVGLLLHVSGVCPIVKRIWTPAWTFFSAGWCLLLLAGFYLVVDVWKLRAWTWPALVVGTNSLAIYMMSWLLKGWIDERLRTHLGQDVYYMFGENYVPLTQSVMVLAVMWLICLWMYRHRIFLRI